MLYWEHDLIEVLCCSVFVTCMVEFCQPWPVCVTWSLISSLTAPFDHGATPLDHGATPLAHGATPLLYAAPSSTAGITDTALVEKGRNVVCEC